METIYSLKERLLELTDEIENDRHLTKKVIANLNVFDWNTIESSTRVAIVDICDHMETEIFKVKKILEELKEKKEDEE